MRGAVLATGRALLCSARSVDRSEARADDRSVATGGPVNLRSLVLTFCCAIVLSFVVPAQVGAAAPAPACALCTEQAVACPTCNGSGTCAIPCLFCSKGRVECTMCSSEQRGWIDCPNRFCRGGKTQWEGGDADPCKLCAAKGRVPCPSCRGQQAPSCGACAGTGTRQRTCWTCAGKQRIACPACAVDPRRAGCGSCDGSGKVACARCEVATKGAPVCIVCNGAGDRPCTTCRGLDRVPCAKCAATGKMRLASQKYPGVPTAREKAGVKQCELCEGKATKNCADCKKGRVDCPSCDKSKPASACLHCLQQRAIGCDECLSGGWSRLEILGDWLLAHDRPRHAAAFYTAALERVQAMKGPVSLTELHLTALDVQMKLQSLQAASGALRQATGGASGAKEPGPTLPPAAVLETFWPVDVRKRYWPDAPAGHELGPWRDAEWMAAHRRALQTRLEASLSKAQEAAGK